MVQLGEDGLVQRAVVGCLETRSWRASSAQLPETTGACSRHDRAAQLWVGCITSHQFLWNTLKLREKKCVWGVRHLFSLNFLYPFKWIPQRRWGLREKSVCPCHSTLIAWTGSFPKECSRRGEDFSCGSLLGLLPCSHCQRGSQRRRKAWKISTDPKGFPGSWNHYTEIFSTNRNVSLPLAPL